MDPSLADAHRRLMVASGGARTAPAAQVTMRALVWLRGNPRLAAALLSHEQDYEAEWSIRVKWHHKLTVMPDYPTAEKEAGRLANELGRFVEIYHRPKPEKPLLAFTVHPDREDGQGRTPEPRHDA